ncbi:hypothetical protein DH09_00865 (plasmid) [Bacillaceae bacterium JMAK1]|nr:hypothetical protein DH09_00865 [Bacillaceae bacterium JMAK1]
MKKVVLFYTIGLMILLVGCSSDSDLEEANANVLKVPDLVKADESYQIAVHLNNEPTIDKSSIDSMEFEIWERAKREDGQIITGETEDDITYFLDYNFQGTGPYFIQARINDGESNYQPIKKVHVQ